MPPDRPGKDPAVCCTADAPCGQAGVPRLPRPAKRRRWGIARFVTELADPDNRAWDRRPAEDGASEMARSEADVELLRAAFLAGFAASAEGWNAEHPGESDPDLVRAWVLARFDRWIGGLS